MNNCTNIHYKKVDKLKYFFGNGSTHPIIGSINGIDYVIKTFNNEQGNKVLINELIAYNIVKQLNLPIPDCELAYIDNNTNIDYNVSSHEFFSDDCKGLAFCSKYRTDVTILSSDRMVLLADNRDYIIPKLLLLDHLIYNKDRNKGNILLTNTKGFKELIIIDHTHIFNLESIWNSVGLQQKIEDEDFKDNFIMQSNYYLYSKFLKAIPINMINLKEAINYFNEKLSEDFFWNLKNIIPEEWEDDKDEINALIEYIIYRFKHLEYYCKLILSCKYEEVL